MEVSSTHLLFIFLQSHVHGLLCASKQKYGSLPVQSEA